MLDVITSPAITVPDWLLALTGVLVVGTAIAVTIYRMNRTVSIVAYGARRYDEGYADAYADEHEYAHERYDAGYEDGHQDGATAAYGVAQRHVAELELAGRDDELVPDTWLRDQLNATYAWAERQRDLGARWTIRTARSAPRPPRELEQAPLLELESVA